MYSLVYLVVGIPIALGLSYIFKGDTLKDDAFKDEAYEIRMFNRTGRVGLLCFLLCLFLLIIGFAEGSANGWKGVIVLQLIFGIPGIPLLIMYLNHKVIFDKEKLVVSSWLGIKKTIFWNDIIDIKYVVKWGYIKVKTKDTAVKLSTGLNGINRLIIEIRRNTELTIGKIDQSFYIEDVD